MEEKTVSVTMEMDIALTQEDIDDIMGGALDGGISYWCSTAEPVGGYLGEYASEQISRGGELRLYDAEEGASYHLDLAKLLTGIRLWAEDAEIGHSCLVMEGGKLRIDCGQADAAVCDMIVQCALFGEVIYG